MPALAVIEPGQDLFRRVGYHDFRAYTQLTSAGLHQGFVLARHHTMAGTVQVVFRAGEPHPKSVEALAMALAKLDHLATLASEASLQLQPGEQSI